MSLFPKIGHFFRILPFFFVPLHGKILNRDAQEENSFH